MAQAGSFVWCIKADAGDDFAKSSWSFDEGGRIEQFHEFENSVQFRVEAEKLATRAKNEALVFCERFSSVALVELHLTAKPTDSLWGNYHAAMAALAVGDLKQARDRVSLIAAADEHAPWVSELKVKSAAFIARAATGAQPREVVSHEITIARLALKLPTVEPSFLWEPAQ